MRYLPEDHAINLYFCLLCLKAVFSVLLCNPSIHIALNYINNIF